MRPRNDTGGDGSTRVAHVGALVLAFAGVATFVGAIGPEALGIGAGWTAVILIAGAAVRWAPGAGTDLAVGLLGLVLAVLGATLGGLVIAPAALVLAAHGGARWCPLRGGPHSPG